MLSLFRTNQIFTSVLYILYILLLWHPVFVLEIPAEHLSSGALGAWLDHWSEQHLTASRIAAIALLWIQAILVSTIVNRYRIAQDANLIPGLIYLLVSSCIPEFLHLSPLLVANTFFLLSLYNLFDTYKKSSCADLLFNTGWWTGIASFFYMPYLYFIVFCIIASGILRSAQLKEYLMIATGLLVAYFLVGLYFFWVDQLPWFLAYHFEQAGFIFRDITWEKSAMIKAGLFLLLILFILLNVGRYTYKQNISAQKYISVLYTALFWGGLSVLLQKRISLDSLLLCAIPVGIFTGITFAAIRNRLAAEMLHFILLAAIIMAHYLLPS